ncbi:cysteine-rich CWC family protein [bacterium LRH843]|nr:cysteine-rich CWC family protein [bacterium LRH843]
MSIGESKFECCPLCGSNNNCCNSKEKSLGECWCTDEKFPNEIFDLVPVDQARKTCICKNCLEKFKKKE